MIDLVFKNHTSQKLPREEFFKKVLEMAAKELKLKKSFSISINLVGESKIRELNKKYRHKNKSTDVLSFPMGGKYEIRNTKYVIRDLGDIFVCLSIAKKDAKRENISIERKLAQLVVHGFLHLQGYDHEVSEASARKMFMLERKIMDRLDY